MPTDARSSPQTEPATLLSLAERCDIGNLDAAVVAVVQRAASRSGGYVCLCNVHVLVLAIHSPEVRTAIEHAWKRLPDGAPVAWLQRRAGHEQAQRVGGPDLMPRVVEGGRVAGLRHFLLGSTHNVLARVEGVLQGSFPGCQIVGAHSPPYGCTPAIDYEAITAIRATDANVVWCALGAPKQELWMSAHAPLLPDVLFVGVGAAFDFIAGAKARAPQWMRGHGLEWLHRLATEPRRLGGRYIRTNTEFVCRSGLELTRRRLFS